MSSSRPIRNHLLSLLPAVLAAAAASACVDDGPLPDGVDEGEADVEDPPTYEEQLAEQAIRARLVAGIDPARWANYTADGTARFATPTGDSEDERLARIPDTAPGDGVLVLADGRKFRHRDPAAARGGRVGPSELDRTFSVLGSDTRTAVATGDYTKYPWRATGTLLANKDSKAGFCTGAMIGPRLVLTAGHCVYNKDTNSWNWNMWFSPGHRGRGDDRFANGTPRRVIALYSFDGWFEDENTEHDVGFLILEDEARTASLGWFGFSSQWSIGDHEGITATTLQYPGWKATCADSPDPSGQCFAFQYRGTGTVDTTCGNKLAHSVDTNKGSSGSPFYRWSGGGRYIIGPHTNGGTSYCGPWKNLATQLTDKKVGYACTLLLAFPSVHAFSFCS